MKKKVRLDLQSKSIEELKKQLKEARSLWFQQKMDQKMNSLKNLSSISVKQDEIAIVQSILSEKVRSEKNAAREEQHGQNT